MCIHVDHCNGTSAPVLTESEKPSSVALNIKSNKQKMEAFTATEQKNKRIQILAGMSG